MLRYIAGRLALMAPTLILITLLIFGVLHMVPGDPAAIFLGDLPATPERLAQVRHMMGLDRPVVAQYADFMARLLRGDLGRSLRTDAPVAEEIGVRLPYSAALGAAAFGVVLVLGLVLGTIAALGRSTWLDALAMTIALLGVSMPVFWLSLMLIYLFSLQLGWFPVTGFGGWERLVLPSLALGLVSSATLARLVRSSLLEILTQPFVTTARSKGLARWSVLWKHVAKNALIPVVTVMGLQFGSLLSGAVITETVFARPGVGKLLVEAVLNKDFPLVQGTVLFVAIVYLFLNLAVDVSYAYLDPRIRFD